MTNKLEKEDSMSLDFDNVARSFLFGQTELRTAAEQTCKLAQIF